jgi:hypothetical protein
MQVLEAGRDDARLMLYETALRSGRANWLCRKAHRRNRPPALRPKPLAGTVSSRHRRCVSRVATVI